MRENELVVHAEEELDVVTRKLREKNALISPVVDDAFKLVGVVTAMDVIRELEMEATDELLRYGGVGNGDEAVKMVHSITVVGSVPVAQNNMLCVLR